MSPCQVVSSRWMGKAFAVFLLNGPAVTWGDPRFGGDCRRVKDRLRQVQQIEAPWSRICNALRAPHMLNEGGPYISPAIHSWMSKKSFCISLVSRLPQAAGPCLTKGRWSKCGSGSCMCQPSIRWCLILTCPSCSSGTRLSYSLRCPPPPAGQGPLFSKPPGNIMPPPDPFRPLFEALRRTALRVTMSSLIRLCTKYQHWVRGSCMGWTILAVFRKKHQRVSSPS